MARQDDGAAHNALDRLEWWGRGNPLLRKRIRQAIQQVERGATRRPARIQAQTPD